MRIMVILRLSVLLMLIVQDPKKIGDQLLNIVSSLEAIWSRRRVRSKMLFYSSVELEYRVMT